MISATELPPPPRPEPPPEHQPYWQGLIEGELRVQQCRDCGRQRLYPRPMCDACYSLEYTWHAIPGDGTVHSFTECHHPFHPGFKADVPYVLVTVDLGDGLRLHAPLLAVCADEVSIGMAVSFDVNRVDAELSLPCFRRAGG